MKNRLPALVLGLALAPVALQAAGGAASVESALDKGDLTSAVEAGESLVKESPTSESWYWLGRAYGEKARRASIFTQLSWAKKCRLAFEKSVSLDPRSVDARMALLQYHVHAPRIVGGGLDKAQDDVGVLAKLDAARGHWAEGLVATKRKDLARAERELLAAIEADPEWAGAKASLVEIYVETRRFPQARAMCERALEQAPGDVRLTSLLAQITSEESRRR